MNRTAHNQAEEAFQREQLQMTLNLLNQVDDRDMYFPMQVSLTKVDSRHLHTLSLQLLKMRQRIVLQI